MSAEFTYISDHTNELIPAQKWVRVFFGGQAIADSRRVLLVRFSDRTPIYFFPPDDVRQSALVRSEHTGQSTQLGVRSQHILHTGV